MEDDEQDCRFLASAYSSAKEGNSTLGWCKQEAATPNAILHGKSSVTSQVRKPQKAVTLKVTIQHLKKKEPHCYFCLIITILSNQLVLVTVEVHTLKIYLPTKYAEKVWFSYW